MFKNGREGACLICSERSRAFKDLKTNQSILKYTGGGRNRSNLLSLTYFS